MKWFRHDASANRDAKLQKLRIKYGLEGYGLYWYCIELIAEDVEESKLTFELEHDAEIIAFNTGSHHEKVQEMMAYMVKLGLFENRDGVITCFKLAKRLDQSSTSNPQMRKIISDLKKNPDKIMTESGCNHDAVMTESDQIRLDKIRLEEKEKEKKKRPSALDIDLSEWPSQPSKQVLKDWLSHRKAKRASNSQTAFNTIGKELHKAKALGYSVDECLSEALTRGWAGFKAEWMTSKSAPATSRPANAMQKAGTEE